MNFIPKVPSCVMEGEDNQTPRICFSSDIKKALLSMPDSYEGLYNKYYMQLDKGIPALFNLFETNTEEVGLDFIKTPEELTSEGLVPDAEIHQEYWVLKKLSKNPSSLVWIENMEQDIETDEVKDLKIQFSVEDKERIFTFSFVYESEYLGMKELLIESNLPFREDINPNFFDFGEGKYELTVQIAAGFDVTALWLYYYSMRFQYEGELSTEDFEQVMKYCSPFCREEGLYV